MRERNFFRPSETLRFPSKSSLHQGKILSLLGSLNGFDDAHASTVGCEGRFVEGQTIDGHAQGPDIGCLPREEALLGVAALRRQELIGALRS